MVGDNIDHEITVWVQSKHHQNRSTHWTNQFAIVQDPALSNLRSQKQAKEIMFAELVPGDTVQESLLHCWAVLISRIITRHLTAFRPLKDKVVWHIPHTYSKEMATKPTLVNKNRIYLLFYKGCLWSTVFCSSILMKPISVISDLNYPSNE